MSTGVVLVALFLLLFVLLPFLALLRLAWRFLHGTLEVGGTSWGKQITASKERKN